MAIVKWATLQLSFMPVPNEAKCKEVQNNILTSGTCQTAPVQWIGNTPV